MLDTVSVVPVPEGRRGCKLLFADYGLHNSIATDLAELRKRNKLISARATTEEEKTQSKEEDQPEKDVHKPRTETTISSTVAAKTEKMLRQRKNENFKCLFVIKEVAKVEIQASCQLTVSEIKVKMLSEAKKTLRALSKSGAITRAQRKQLLKEADDYCIKIVGLDQYIVNESLALQRVDFIQVCNLAFVTPRFEMVEKTEIKELDEDARKTRIKSELALGTQIASLVGSAQLSNFLKYENDEIADFRRSATRQKRILNEEKKKKLASLNNQVLKDERIQLLPEYLFGEPMPLTVCEELVISVNFPENGQHNLNGCCKVTVRAVETVNSLKKLIFRKYRITLGAELASQTTEEDYILKVTGFQEYLYGDSQLISYDHIRRCISNSSSKGNKFDSEPIELTLVPLTDLEETLKELTNTYDSIVDQLLILEDHHYDEDPSNVHINEEQIFQVHEKYKIMINSVERITLDPELIGEDCYLYIQAELYHAGHKLGQGFTVAAPACSDPQWNERIIFDDVLIRNIPQGTRVLFTLYHRRCDPTSAWVKAIERNDQILSWVGTQLFDHNQRIKDGMTNFRMWTDIKKTPIGTCYQNLLKMNSPILFTEFCGTTTVGKRIYYPNTDEYEASEPGAFSKYIDNSEAAQQQLRNIIEADPLTQLTPNDKLILWNNRHKLISNKIALPKFLLSVRWDDCSQVKEAHSLLRQWSTPTPLQALELLDAKFADPKVREYGISCLNYMSDSECYDFMLQLTQVLKHEPYHNSPLAKFLLRRAWINPKIGHSFYWFLKAEMHLEEVAERYTLLLDSYLRGCGPQLKELLKQNEVMDQLKKVAEKIKTTSTADRKKVLIQGLEKLKLPSSFQLPLDQRLEVKALRTEKCKYMDSKKLPLWLVWENVEDNLGKPISVIFKVGDDLRQDVLTLQVIRIFDKLWKKEGLDLLLKPYGCIATGDEIGMIEVVKNADTTANINKSAGGTKAVLKEDTLTKWLKQHNTTDEKWKKAQDTFVLSCAGYCVATFVLGIGDRHNDNIMLTREGNLFHIDFGHFLGNYKKKYGIKRERAPFIFTPQYAHVLEGKNAAPFNKYVDICCRAFNILRRHKDVFITLFQMMLCTGIPELASADDINYLRYAFAIGKSDEEAAIYFKKLIFSSLNTKTTIINDAIHVFVHR